MQGGSEGSRLGTAEDEECGVEPAGVPIVAELERLKILDCSKNVLKIEHFTLRNKSRNIVKLFSRSGAVSTHTVESPWRCRN
jgi:hypothetical protein